MRYLFFPQYMHVYMYICTYTCTYNVRVCQTSGMLSGLHQTIKQAYSCTSGAHWLRVNNSVYRAMVGLRHCTSNYRAAEKQDLESNSVLDDQPRMVCEDVHIYMQLYSLLLGARHYAHTYTVVLVNAYMYDLNSDQHSLGIQLTSMQAGASG